MKSVLYLSEAPVSLQRLAPLVEAGTAGRVYFTSPNVLAVQRGADFADVLSGDDIPNDYEEGELEAVGLNRSRLHACVITYRETELFAELLEVLALIATPAWVDDDHGTVMPVEDFVARLRRRFIVRLDPPWGDTVEAYERADRNLGRVRVQLPNGDMVTSGYRVELALSRDAMIGLATDLLRMAHQDPDTLLFRHARSIERGLASMAAGFYLVPESGELMIAEADLGTVAEHIEARDAAGSG